MRVSTILDSIDQGAVALPEFQRGYVWNRNQVRGLIDSMYRQHPVGSLLTWQTQTENADARGDPSLQPGTVQLLLDGQQRITTLYGLIRGTPPPFFDGNEAAFTDLRFHLEQESFEFFQPVRMGDDPLWVDVTSVMQRGAGEMIAQLFADAGSDAAARERAQTWSGRLNRIEQIQAREFHVELVTGEDKTVEVVVDIFNRVNSGGTKLSKGDLALAKVCAEWPDARDEFKARLEAWRDAGFGFELDWLLRVINAVVTGRAPFSALADCSPEEIREGLDRAERAINVVLNAIASRLGLDHRRVLPGVYAFPVLARYVADRGFAFNDHRDRDRLLYWYLQASMWGRFSASTETVLAQDLLAVTRADGDPVEELVGNVRQQRGSLEVTPDDFRAWSRGARFYPLLYMLTRVDGARDWGTGDQLSHFALGRQTDLEIHHIFPKSLLYQAGYQRSEVNALANFTFLTQETNREISDRHPSEYIAEYEGRHPGAVGSHWMPMDEGLRETENYPRFLQMRRELLAKATNRFLAKLWEGEIEEFEVVSGREPLPTTEASEASVDDEGLVIEELQTWLRDAGVDIGESDHQLADRDGNEVAALDLAFPRGVLPELSEPAALLIDEPSEVIAAASSAGYRVFTTVDEFKQYVTELALVESEPIVV